MLRRMGLIRTDVLEERVASIIRVTRSCELESLAVTSNRVFLRSMLWLLVTASFVPSSPIHVTLVMEALRSSETLFVTTATRRNIPEDGILHSHLRENLSTYTALTGLAL
jgi:hypothetical protein